MSTYNYGKVPCGKQKSPQHPGTATFQTASNVFVHYSAQGEVYLCEEGGYFVDFLRGFIGASGITGRELGGYPRH